MDKTFSIIKPDATKRKITIESTDTYGIVGETDVYLDARNIILLE